MDGGHAGADAEGFDAAFEGCNALFKDGVGGISDAGVDVAFNLIVEQGGAMLCAVEFECDRLIDGHSDCFGDGVTVESGVNR
jgi:hypothetical protein